MIFVKRVCNSIKKTVFLIRKSFLNSLPNDFCNFSHAKKIFFLIAYTLLLISVFGTIMFQSPNFVNLNFNTYFIIVWPVLALVLLILDYKKFLFYFFRCLIFVVPFLFYLALAALFKIDSFSSELARYIFLSFFILILGSTFSTYVKNQTKKWILVSYCLASFLLAILTYVLVLKNADLDSQIYAYGSKNSTGPILLCASIFVFFIFDSNKVFFQITKWALAFFFLVMIALMKCRAALIVAPIIYFALFIYTKPSTTKYIIVFSIIAVSLILLFAIPYLKHTIIDNILLNNKTNIDDLSSGRISSIIRAFQIFKPVLGNGDTYVDCFPVQLICSYGILGTISLFPLIGLRFYILYPTKKYDPNRANFSLLLLLTIFYVSNSLLEGHGSFGPGARSFIYWLIIGFSFGRVSELPLDSLNKKICDKTSPKVLSISLNSLFSTILIFTILIPNIFESLSSKLYDRIDRSIISGEFISPESVAISGPDTICVGQTISYKANVYPENSSDIGCFWEAWSSSGVLQIDSNTGEATAIGTGKITINVFTLHDKSVHSTKVINVVKPQDFSFSNYTVNLEKTNMLIGDRQEIIYDKNYIPNSSLISFVSSDESVAVVDDLGTITAVNSGSCVISSKLKQDETVFSNNLEIFVENKETVPVSKIETKIPETVWQYEPISLDLSFNEGVTNKDVLINITGSSYSMDDDKIIFEEPGNSSIEIKSLNNPSICVTKKISVIKNSPIKLSAEPIDWIVLNRKYKLNVIIEHESGLKRLGTAKDLMVSSLRASEENSGVCDDDFTLYTSMSGYAHVTYQSKENFDLAKRVNFVVRKTAYENYIYSAKVFGLYLISAVSIVSVLVTLIIDSKRRYLHQIGFGMISLTSLIILIFIHLKLWNIVNVIPLLLVLIIYVAISVLLRKKNFELMDESTLPLLEFEKDILFNKPTYCEVEI